MMPSFEYLPDPQKDRKCKDVPLPLLKPVTMDAIYNNNQINWGNLRTVFEREGRLEKSVCMRILKEASDLFKTEPNLLALKEPVCVVGDIHGQYYDLLKILEIGGNPTEMQYDDYLYIYLLRRLCR